MTTSAVTCPDVRQQNGFERAVMLLGLAMTRWAQERADVKAMSRRRAPLANLSDAERADLHRESTALRDATYAQRTMWHAIG